MEVIEGLSKLRKRLENSIIALGTFDGVHRGHQEVIRVTKEIAERNSMTSAVVTFEPIPKAVIGGRREQIGSITSIKQKENIIRNLGIDVMLIIRFNRKLARLEPEEFVKRVICKRIAARGVVVGPGFRFGRNRSGNVMLLKRLGKKYGFEVTTAGEVRVDDMKVSSSKVRELLWRGKIEQANRLLGRYYSINGIVKRGSGRGKELSFPTANLDISGNVILFRGVYVVLVIVKKRKYWGVANIGLRPTFSPSHLLSSPVGRFARPVVEVHIFNFAGNLYGQKIELFLTKRIRGEMKFSSHEKLIQQIEKDIEFAKKLRSF